VIAKNDLDNLARLSDAFDDMGFRLCGAKLTGALNKATFRN